MCAYTEGQNDRATLDERCSKSCEENVHADDPVERIDTKSLEVLVEPHERSGLVPGCAWWLHRGFPLRAAASHEQGDTLPVVPQCEDLSGKRDGVRMKEAKRVACRPLAHVHDCLLGVWKREDTHALPNA